MGKSQQRKGADGERELSALFNEYGFNTKRGSSRSFGTMPDISGLPGIHIEVKRVERLNVSEAMKQSERDALRFNDGAPALFHRKNRESWLVTMRFEDWMKIYRRSRWEEE